MTTQYKGLQLQSAFGWEHFMELLAKNLLFYQGLILHPGCPLNYCVDHPVNIILNNLDFQCNHNHSRTLCGSCREGYSIALGTLHCLPDCSNDSLTLILPFALSEIALVASCSYAAQTDGISRNNQRPYFLC